LSWLLVSRVSTSQLKLPRQLGCQTLIEVLQLVLREHRRHVGTGGAVIRERFIFQVGQHPYENAVLERPVRVNRSEPLQDVGAKSGRDPHRRREARTAEHSLERRLGRKHDFRRPRQTVGNNTAELDALE